jgi:hypothetical protein
VGSSTFHFKPEPEGSLLVHELKKKQNKINTVIRKGFEKI